MPFDRGVGARQFGIDLAVVKLDVRADKCGHAGGHAAVAHDLEIGFRHFNRGVDPAQCRHCPGLIQRHVETGAAVDDFTPTSGMVGAFGDPAREILLQGQQLGPMPSI